MESEQKNSIYERLLSAQESQIADLRRENEGLRQSLAVERKRAGFGGILSGAGANFLYGFVVANATQARSWFVPYYYSHVPTVWGLGFVAVMFTTLGLCLGLMGRNVYREWKQARAEGGALGLYNVQFKYSVVACLVGLMMLIFRGSSPPATPLLVPLGMMIVGAMGLAYNFRRGQEIARRSGDAFPILR